MYLTQHQNRFQALKQMLDSERQRLFLSLSSALLCTLIEIVPWISLYVGLIAVTQGESALSAFLCMAIAIVVRYGLYMVAVWQAHLVAYHVIQKVRQHMINALALLSSEQFQTYHRGDVEKRITDDTQSLEPLIAHHSTDIINGVLMPILMIGLMFFIDWRLGVIALLPLPVAAVVQYMMMRGFEGRYEKYNAIVARMHEAQLEFLRSIGVMKLYGVDSASYLQLSRAMDKHNKIVTVFTDQMIGAWVTFVTLAQASLLLVMPAAIAFMAIGSLPPANGAMAIILSVGLLKPWLDLTQIFGQVQQSFVAVARLVPLFGDDRVRNAAFLSPLNTLQCRDLIIERGERRIIDGVTLSFSPGDTAIFQGKSGCGKTSLLESLSGSLSAHHGGWYFNDQNVEMLSDKNRSQYLAVVDQFPVFFSGSLRDNITLAAPKATDEEIWQVLELVKLVDLVDSLPHQLDTDMGETQRDFSGGELQRLAIARAVITRAPILVLDEATAHLDSLTEQAVLQAIRGYCTAQIQLIISHRAQPVRDHQRVFLLNEGNVEELSHG
ncbi:ATP-binding cassette domain-containing protein [Thaumasiovibrio subtropicus]|uniref:ATP-binding cassette domain-containing protein n=1 Tax=Thaumasiovibrio subtropicus TaxID=1891207 RepID=UPI000B353FE6|nr:ABC transporter ATP-binding protein [Thaumasiovibrio subtropicus]